MHFALVVTVYATMAVRRKMCSARVRSPSSVDDAMACVRSMPRVKTRQAIACGMTARAAGGWVLDDVKAQPWSSFARSQRSPQGPGKSAREAVENGAVEFGRHEAGEIDGVTDLLLVMPALSEFARGVEPVEGDGFSGPTHIEEGGRKGIERFVEVGALAARGPHHVDENRGAEAPVYGDALAVEAIHEIDNVLTGANERLLDETTIADQGEFAQGCIEQMSGDIADFPCRGERLKVQVFGAQTLQELDEH